MYSLLLFWILFLPVSAGLIYAFRANIWLRCKACGGFGTMRRLPSSSKIEDIILDEDAIMDERGAKFFCQKCQTRRLVKM